MELRTDCIMRLFMLFVLFDATQSIIEPLIAPTHELIATIERLAIQDERSHHPA